MPSTSHAIATLAQSNGARMWGFCVCDPGPQPRHDLVAVAYADDVDVVGPTVGSVAAILYECAGALKSRWSLDIKPGSREALSARGADVDVPADLRVGLSVNVLGHALQANSSTAACPRAAVTNARRAFEATAGGGPPGGYREAQAHR